MKVLVEDAVGSYEDIDLAGGQPLANLLHLLCAFLPAYIFHIAGKILQPAAESLVMLQRKDGGRHQHSHLLAVGDSLEGGPHCDFGFSEADVAAYQAVHRVGALHIFLDSHCSFLLVGSVLIHK